MSGRKKITNLVEGQKNDNGGKEVWQSLPNKRFKPIKSRPDWKLPKANKEHQKA
jgi:hypothetical protein